MGWSLGHRNGRDIGYGVPAYCDHPKCTAKIDRGISYCCGGFDGDHGCGLYFCENHRHYHTFRDGETAEVCDRCHTYRPPFKEKPDHPQWIRWKLKDPSWATWRKNNESEVTAMQIYLGSLKK